ncbi:MAG: ABC transporter substrate-binding protein [Lachnospiraceae bacterium]|nr:ABC transporter substrate-binding protein [Lachnospiraceae bacterium]
MKKLLALLLAGAMTLSCAACGGTAQTSKDSGAGSEELIPMKIAFCTWAGYAPVFIAIEKGYFAEAGYDAEVVIMEDESTYGAAFVSNSIQALGQVMDRDIIQVDAGAPEQYVCTMDCSTGGDGLVATGDIQTMDDLAGKTVALDKSATSYFFFLQALADSNITEDQITIVEMGNDAAGEAFIAGNVDAAVTWEPALSSCGEREGGHILVSSADYPKAIIDVLTVNTNFLEEHPDAADVLNDCWNKAVAYLNDNFDEGCEIMAKGLSLDKQDVMDECAGITFYDEAMNKEFNDLGKEGNVKEIAQMAADFWVEKGYMKSADVEGFFAYLQK